MDAANLLKPALARGQLRLIGATTEEEYTKYLEKDKALDRRFEKVKVEEPDTDTAIRIVQGVIPKYQEHHDMAYTAQAAEAAVKYAQRYLSERNLPDVGLDLVDEAASEFSVKAEFARAALPTIKDRIDAVEKAIAACDGKAKVESTDEYTKLTELFDKFERDMERLDGFWGHRLEAAEGVEA